MRQVLQLNPTAEIQAVGLVADGNLPAADDRKVFPWRVYGLMSLLEEVQPFADALQPAADLDVDRLLDKLVGLETGDADGRTGGLGDARHHDTLVHEVLRSLQQLLA